MACKTFLTDTMCRLTNLVTLNCMLTNCKQGFATPFQPSQATLTKLSQCSCSRLMDLNSIFHKTKPQAVTNVASQLPFQNHFKCNNTSLALAHYSDMNPQQFLRTSSAHQHSQPASVTNSLCGYSQPPNNKFCCVSFVLPQN